MARSTFMRGNKASGQARSKPQPARPANGSADPVEELQSGLRRRPDDPELRFALARALLRVGRTSEAEAQLRQAIQQDPGHRDALTLYGFLLERRRASGEAARLFQSAIEQFPEDAGFRLKLGRSLRRLGRAGEATAALTDALELAPGSIDTRYELGVALQLEGKFPQARHVLQEALRQGPYHVACRAALASVESALAPPPCDPTGQPAVRVALHMNKSFHFSILDPIFQALRRSHQVMLTAEAALLQKFQPEILIVADAQGRRFRRLFPDATLIFVRHGLITKRHLGEAAAGCDFVAGVSSDTVRDEIVKHSGIAPERIWVTGHVPMDPLFRGEGVATNHVPLPPGRKTVLFAPTWNRHMSGLGLVGQRVAELLLGTETGINLIIKPHPTTLRDQGDWMAALRAAARDRSDIWLVDDPANDGMSLLPLADVLVSDASSLIFAYLACDRPLVLITHPRHRQDPGYDAHGIEWRWRDVGEEVLDIETLPAAVRRALDQPGARAEARARYRRMLFGEYTDGHAAERIAARIAALPRRRESRP